MRKLMNCFPQIDRTTCAGRDASSAAAQTRSKVGLVVSIRDAQNIDDQKLKRCPMRAPVFRGVSCLCIPSHRARGYVASSRRKRRHTIHDANHAKRHGLLRLLVSCQPVPVCWCGQGVCWSARCRLGTPAGAHEGREHQNVIHPSGTRPLDHSTTWWASTTPNGN